MTQDQPRSPEQKRGQAAVMCIRNISVGQEHDPGGCSWGWRS